MWSESVAKISTEAVDTVLPLLNITWTKQDFVVVGYRVTLNEFPAGTLIIEGTPSGVEVSGNVGSPWGYLDVTYLNLSGDLVTLNNPTDILNEIPSPNHYSELISVNYDPTPQQDFHFTAWVDWEELDAVTGASKSPPVYGSDSFVFFYTILNNWTGNKNNLDALMTAKGNYNASRS